MSRKQPSFAQLYDYIVRDNDNDTRYNFLIIALVQTENIFYKSFIIMQNYLKND